VTKFDGLADSQTIATPLDDGSVDSNGDCNADGCRRPDKDKAATLGAWFDYDMDVRGPSETAR
jgi:hypothetical protein